MKNELIAAALEARKNAYAPYSEFFVGAAVLSTQGKIFAGVNVENCSYGLTICAERNAISYMIASGHKAIKAIAIATEDGSPPCGACLQVISEFAEDDILIHLCSTSGEVVTSSLENLFPTPFQP